MVDNIDPVAAMQFNANNAVDVLHRDRKVDIQKDKKYGHMVWRVPHVLGCGIGPVLGRLCCHRYGILSSEINTYQQNKRIDTAISMGNRLMRYKPSSTLFVIYFHSEILWSLKSCLDGLGHLKGHSLKHCQRHNGPRILSPKLKSSQKAETNAMPI